jgi:L-serine/L-threonine ammonia-lyase
MTLTKRTQHTTNTNTTNTTKQGLARHGWDDVQVVATETEGAASFAAGFAAGKPVRLPGITSLATSLGALEVTPAALEYARRQPTSARVVTDAEAVSACRRFLQDHRLLVEPACGAALALGYTPRHREEIRRASEARGGRPVVIVVCGGSGVTAEILQEMERGVGLVG